MSRQLVIDALLMAIQQRSPKAGWVHHTDQGVIYATSAYRAVLNADGLIASMSRKGNCHDAVAKSFLSNLKNGLTWHETSTCALRLERQSLITSSSSTIASGSIKTLDYDSPVRYQERVDP